MSCGTKLQHKGYLNANTALNWQSIFYEDGYYVTEGGLYKEDVMDKGMTQNGARDRTFYTAIQVALRVKLTNHLFLEFSP